MPGPQLDGSSKVAKCLLEVAGANEHGPPIVVDIGVVGAQLESAFEVRDGFVPATVLYESITQVVVRDGGIRVRPEHMSPERLRVAPHLRLLPSESAENDQD